MCVVGVYTIDGEGISFLEMWSRGNTQTVEFYLTDGSVRVYAYYKHAPRYV